LRHRVIVVACAVALFPLSARSDAITLPFASNDTGVTKILKLIEWVRAADDLAAMSDALPNALGLSKASRIYYTEVDGKQVKDWTDYLLKAPIWPGAQSTMDYTVPEPNAPAGHWRADIRLYLNSSEACVQMGDMVSRFGEPTDTYIVTDGGGRSYEWKLREKPWKTVVGGYFGPNNKGCGDLTIIEYPMGS